MTDNDIWLKSFKKDSSISDFEIKPSLNKHQIKITPHPLNEQKVGASDNLDLKTLQATVRDLEKENKRIIMNITNLQKEFSKFKNLIESLRHEISNKQD